MRGAWLCIRFHATEPAITSVIRHGTPPIALSNGKSHVSRNSMPMQDSTRFSARTRALVWCRGRTKGQIVLDAGTAIQFLDWPLGLTNSLDQAQCANERETLHAFVVCKA